MLSLPILGVWWKHIYQQPVKRTPYHEALLKPGSSVAITGERDPSVPGVGGTAR